MLIRRTNNIAELINFIMTPATSLDSYVDLHLLFAGKPEGKTYATLSSSDGGQTVNIHPTLGADSIATIKTNHPMIDGTIAQLMEEKPKGVGVELQLKDGYLNLTQRSADITR
jgi:hypothetical protein